MKNIAILSVIIALTGCSAAQQDKQIGMANPASVYCEQIGGKLEIINNKDGQVGYCSLPSGEKIEEWTLYRRDHK